MKSQQLLDSFTKYCKEHPQERFWQALRNWSGWGFILVCNMPYEHWGPENKSLVDTFYWEKNRQP